uniref:Uncharacterized protein n=1 Tax=Syphacia muris TaxID=451379 RepID=A0A0N5ALX7_9BILA
MNEPQSNETKKSVEDELQKLGNVTEEAVAASVINEKLLATLQLHKEKFLMRQREALKKLRMKQTEEQRGAAKDALEQVELTRLRVHLHMYVWFSQGNIRKKRKGKTGPY